ncbi:1,2-phenylacetyl-CoA epoxidase subunit PaaD [Marinicella litoralis]|nr:1,2-phenylacetyl-CoA epoxidase subunit PaaD [Marinicella litoralis]
MTENQVLTADAIYQLLAEVKDPEIPVISIQDLGVLQQVKIHENSVHVGIIPTYSGCPAMHAIKTDIKAALLAHADYYGIDRVVVELLDKPVWTTDMITDKGKAAMLAYGIAPPLNAGEQSINCPQCGSDNTQCISEFGSTACKALYRCNRCLEPFDYFKCHA